MLILYIEDLRAAFGRRFPEAVEYVLKCWYQPYKEMFVSFWIDQYLHLEQTSLSRVEGAHKVLKGILQSSTMDMFTFIKAIHKLMDRQHQTNENKACLRTSMEPFWSEEGAV